MSFGASEWRRCATAVKSAVEHRAQSRGRPRRFFFANRAAQFIQARLQKFLGIKGRHPREQFVKQHAQRVNIAARVDVQPAHFRLLRAHVRRRADELLECREQRLVGQSPLRGLGDSEINHLRHRHAVVQRYQDVRWLDVAMDDSLLMRVLDRVANLRE